MHPPPKILVLFIYYAVIAVIGIIANLAVIVILLRRRCGLSRCITAYLLSMAVTDLLVIITGVILNRIAPMSSPSGSLTIIPACKVNFFLGYAAKDCSVWVTVIFTFDRFVAICCQRLKPKYCTERTASIVIGTVCAASCLRNIYTLFMYEPAHKTEPTPCIIMSTYYTSPGWIAFDWMESILNPCLPFVLILLFNFLTVRHILVAIRIRRRFQGGGNSENQSDPETESRRKSIVLLLSVSGIFILFWLLELVNFLYVRFADISYFSGSNINDLIFPLEESGFACQFLCSCLNPFIYGGTQSRIRDEIMLCLKYPVTLINKLIK